MFIERQDEHLLSPFQAISRDELPRDRYGDHAGGGWDCPLVRSNNVMEKQRASLVLADQVAGYGTILSRQTWLDSWMSVNLVASG